MYFASSHMWLAAFNCVSSSESDPPPFVGTTTKHRWVQTAVHVVPSCCSFHRRLGTQWTHAGVTCGLVMREDSIHLSLQVGFGGASQAAIAMYVEGCLATIIKYSICIFTNTSVEHDPRGSTTNQHQNQSPNQRQSVENMYMHSDRGKS